MTSSKSHEGGKLSISSLNGGWEPITGDSHEKLVIKNTLLTPNRGYSYQKNWKTIHLWKNKTTNPKNQKTKTKKEKQHIPNKSNKSKTLQKTTPNKGQNTKQSNKQYRTMITNYMFEMKLNYSELKWMKRNVPRVSLWGMSPSIDKNGNPTLVYHGLIRGYVANIIRYHDWPHNSCTNPVNSTKPWFRFGEK